MTLGQPARPPAGRRVGSARDGEGTDRGELWTVLRALALLVLGIILLSWLIA